jgi:hypothetical protein
MWRLRRTVLAALAASLLGAVPAHANDYCVGEKEGCEATLALALQAAREHDGPDRVLLEDGTYEVPAARADGDGEPVEIVGSGPATELVPELGAPYTLRLGEPGSRAIALTLSPPGATATETLLLAGIASRIVVSAPATGDAPAVRMLSGARLSDAVVAGPVKAAVPGRVERSVLSTDRGAALEVDSGTGTFVLEQAEVTAAEGADAVLDLACAAVSARHLTITGEAPRVADAACAQLEQTASLELRSSVVDGEFPDVARLTGEATAASFHSAHALDADVTATSRLAVADPGFVAPSDLRLKPGSPLVDAGEPGPLLGGEGFWDLGARVRAVDGDGDGALRRDVGAHELQPAAPPVPAGNVLLNPGAEAGESILAIEGESPEPPAWTRTGNFSQVRYGSAGRNAKGDDIFLPTLQAGLALGGGDAFFSAGPGEGGRLIQRIDVAASAAEIDTGLASAALSGLLGGYGVDDDAVRVTATFRDPAGNPISALDLGAVGPADRANATNLLHRSAAGAIPPRTRAVDVEIAGTRVTKPGEVYADAFADNLALVLSVPGIPVPGPVDPAMPPVKNLRPFAGVTVLTGRPRLTPRGRARVGLACASATIGRCSGTLELRRQLAPGVAPTRIAQFARFDIGAGRSTTVTVKLTLAARRALRRAKSFKATLRAVARDGQGLERRTTIPIRVARSAPLRRR